VLSAHSVESSRNGVIALPKQKNFISVLLSAKVWYGVLELSVTLEALSYKDVYLLQLVILLKLLFLTFRSSYFCTGGLRFISLPVYFRLLELRVVSCKIKYLEMYNRRSCSDSLLFFFVVHLRGEQKYRIFLQISSTVSCRGFGDA